MSYWTSAARTCGYRRSGSAAATLENFLSRSRIGIVDKHADQHGPTIFRHACKMGLESIASKRLSAPYRSGRSTEWLKIENPESSAMVRHREGRW
jgi:ATP-dependent DNA ligase